MNIWEAELRSALEAKDQAKAIDVVRQGFPVNIRVKRYDSLGNILPGFTFPLIQSVQQDLLEAAETMIAYGAALTVLDSNGLSPVLATATTGSVEMLQLLLSKGGSLSQRDPRGNTALHIAVTHGCYEYVRHCLRTLKVPALVKNKQGCTPLDLARSLQERSPNLEKVEAMQNLIELLWKTQSSDGFPRMLYIKRRVGPDFSEPGRRVPLQPADDRFESLVSPVRASVQKYLYHRHKAIFQRRAEGRAISLSKTRNEFKPWQFLMPITPKH